MTSYRYRVQVPGGTVRQGILDASGREQALREIEARGWVPIMLETGGERAAAPGLFRFRRPMRVTPQQREEFTRSLATLLGSGVPLSRALDLLHRETVHPAAAGQWKRVHERVIDGMALAEALRQAGGVFPEVYCAMVEAGEAGGFLDLVLAQIAEFQARERTWRANLLTALIYPAVLLALALGVLVFLLVFFIPRFVILFEGLDAELPALTLAIVGISGFLRRHGFWIAAGLALAFFGLRRRLRSTAWKRAGEQKLLKMPGAGPLAANIAVARFCRMLGTLLAAGVPLLQGLRVARRSLGYQTLVDLVAKASERVQQGDSLAAALRPFRELFPGSMVEMLSVAEEGGRLDRELIRLAGEMEAQVDRQLKTAVALMEPLMLFLMAAFIGLIFIGMIIPIFTIQDYIR